MFTSPFHCTTWRVIPTNWFATGESTNRGQKLGLSTSCENPLRNHHQDMELSLKMLVPPVLIHFHKVIHSLNHPAIGVPSGTLT